MPEFKHAPPKYVQIADHIREQILSGDLRVGDEVPSERKLAMEWKVARPTATKALEVLRREGYVSGRPGVGSYVIDPARFHRQASERYRRSYETGHIYLPNERAEILAAEVVEAPAHVAEVLELEQSAPVVQRQRLTLRDDKPVEVSTSWYDATLVDLAPRLVELARIRPGTVAYIEDTTGRRAGFARDRISARMATAKERKLLGLSDPSAVLVSHHAAYDVDDRPMEFAESIGLPEAWTVEHDYPIGR
jgi:GntR family transcriptional regulator